MTREQINADWEIARAAIGDCRKLHTTHEGRDEPRRHALQTAKQAVDRLYEAALKAAEPESLVGKRVRLSDGVTGVIEQLGYRVLFRLGASMSRVRWLPRDGFDILEDTDDKG